MFREQDKDLGECKYLFICCNNGAFYGMFKICNESLICKKPIFNHIVHLLSYLNGKGQEYDIGMLVTFKYLYLAVKTKVMHLQYIEKLYSHLFFNRYVKICVT